MPRGELAAQRRQIEHTRGCKRTAGSLTPIVFCSPSIPQFSAPPSNVVQMASGVVVDLKDVKISPNNCPLTSPLELQLSFTVSESVANAIWKFSFMVDMANKRRVIELGVSEAASYAAGAPCSVKFSIEAIDVTGFKPHQLANTGLLLGACSPARSRCFLHSLPPPPMLSACLMQGESEIVQAMPLLLTT